MFERTLVVIFIGVVVEPKPLLIKLVMAGPAGTPEGIYGFPPA